LKALLMELFVGEKLRSLIRNFIVFSFIITDDLIAAFMYL
jgi:hypothetical protein